MTEPGRTERFVGRARAVRVGGGSKARRSELSPSNSNPIKLRYKIDYCKGFFKEPVQARIRNRQRPQSWRQIIHRFVCPERIELRRESDCRLDRQIRKPPLIRNGISSAKMLVDAGFDPMMRSTPFSSSSSFPSRISVASLVLSLNGNVPIPSCRSSTANRQISCVEPSPLRKRDGGFFHARAPPAPASLRSPQGSGSLVMRPKWSCRLAGHLQISAGIELAGDLSWLSAKAGVTWRPGFPKGLCALRGGFRRLHFSRTLNLLSLPPPMQN